MAAEAGYFGSVKVLAKEARTSGLINETSATGLRAAVRRAGFSVRASTE
jgi:hypothetical protein